MRMLLIVCGLFVCLFWVCRGHHYPCSTGEAGPASVLRPETQGCLWCAMLSASRVTAGGVLWDMLCGGANSDSHMCPQLVLYPLKRTSKVRGLALQECREEWSR